MRKGSTFGARLKATRKQRGLTALNVAIKTGVHFTAMSLWENDHREPVASNLKNLAIALNVSSDYLLGLSKEMRSLG